MRFAGYRLSPGSYLGLHLAVGLVLSIFFVWLFLEIAEGVLTNEEIVAIDYWVSAHVLYLRSSFTNTLMICATNLGGVAFVLSAGSLIVGFLLVKGHPDKAAGFAAAILGGQLLNVLLKIIIQRQRPTDINALVHAGGWSFPSGHAMMSTVFYGMAAYFLAKLYQATGTDAFLEGAHNYVRFCDSSGEDRYGDARSGAFGLAAAVLYAMTDVNNYATIADDVAGNIISAQMGNGSWAEGSMGFVPPAPILDATAENVVILTHMLQTLSTV